MLIASQNKFQLSPLRDCYIFSRRWRPDKSSAAQWILCVHHKFKGGDAEPYIYKSFARATHHYTKENRNINIMCSKDLPSAARIIYSVIMFSSDNAPARISSFISVCERTKKDSEHIEEINARGWVMYCMTLHFSRLMYSSIRHDTEPSRIKA